MTEQLRTLMDREAHRDFAAVDLDAITAAGDRTVRRRRVASGIAGTAALAVVTTAAVLLGGDGEPRAEFVDEPLPTNVPMWTDGSTLHTPDRSVDLGVEVVSFARTTEGIVFAGRESGDRFGVYTLTGTEEPRRIGTSDSPAVVGDLDGRYFAWHDTDAAQVHVVDQRSGDEVWSASTEEGWFPVVDIDGETAYLVDHEAGASRSVDLDSGDVVNYPAGEREHRLVLAVEGDLRAEFVETASGRDNGIEIWRAGADRPVVVDRRAGGAVFSQDGRWVSLWSDNGLVVHDTRTGDARTIDTGAPSDALGYEWLDGDTVMAVAEAGDGEDIAVLSCRVSAGTCTEHATFPGIESGQHFAIGSTALLWGMAAVGEGSASGSEVEASPAETSSTDRPE